MNEKPAPMSIHEAIEVMKIVAPYASDIRIHMLMNRAIRILVDGFQRNNQNENSFRLLALMYHKHLDEIVEYFQDGATGEDMFRLLAVGFSVNPLADLIGSCALIGLVELELSNGRE